MRGIMKRMVCVLAVWMMVFTGFSALVSNDPALDNGAEAKIMTKPVGPPPPNLKYGGEVQNAYNFAVHIRQGDDAAAMEDMQSYVLGKGIDKISMSLSWANWASDAGVMLGKKAMDMQWQSIYDSYKATREQGFTMQDLRGYSFSQTYPDRMRPIRTTFSNNLFLGKELADHFKDDSQRIFAALEIKYQAELWTNYYSEPAQHNFLLNAYCTTAILIQEFSDLPQFIWNQWTKPPNKPHPTKPDQTRPPARPPPSHPGGDNPDDNSDTSSIEVLRTRSQFYAYERLAYDKNATNVVVNMESIQNSPEADRNLVIPYWSSETWAMADVFSREVYDRFDEYIEAIPDAAFDALDKFTFNVSMKALGIKLNISVPDKTLKPFSLRAVKTAMAEDPSMVNSIMDVDRQQILDILKLPRVAVLQNGFWEAVGSMLDSFSEPVTYLQADFDGALASNFPVFIIPSGGLYGLDSSPMFASKLDAYVRGGGTLIVLAQQYGADLRPVPGGLSGYGWAEDQSCQYSSVAITTYMPFLSGQAKTTPDINVDGYFTTYPKDATVVLSRTKNAMPAMLMYNISKGRVIAASSYEDWAFSHYASSEAGKSLLRDLVGWAQDTRTAIPEYGPAAGTMSIPVTLQNRGMFGAVKAQFTVLDPARNNVSTSELAISIAPGGSMNVTLSLAAPTIPGIWWVDYHLIDSSGLIVDRFFDAARFAISPYRASPGGFAYRFSGLMFDITSETETVVRGQDLNFTIHLYNLEDSDQTISITYDWTHSAFDHRTVMVPARGQLNVNYTRIGADSGRFWCWFYDSSGRMLGGASKGITGRSPTITVGVSTDKGSSKEGEAMMATISLSSTIDLREVAVTLTTTDPAGGATMLPGQTVDLEAGVPAHASFNFTPARTSLSGSILLTARAACYANAGIGSCRFDYSGGNGTLSGRVVDWTTNSSIPNAEVRLEGLGNVFSTRSDAGGNYHFDVQGAYYKVQLFASGFNYARATIAVRPHTENSKDIFTTPAGSSVLSVGMQGVQGKTYTIMGDRPVAGASIGVNFSDVEIFTESGQDGGYSMALPAGRYNLSVSIGKGDEAVGEAAVFSGRPTVLDIYVDAAVQTGTVQDIIYGGVIPGASLSFDGILNITADEAGRYCVTLPVGSHTVSIFAQDYSRVDTSIWMMYRNSDNDFYLFPTGNWTGGTVRDIIFNGTVAGANLSFDGTMNVTADANGRYYVMLSTGYHRVNVSADGYEGIVSAGIYVAERSSDNDFYIISLAGTASGTVRDIIYNSTIAGAAVSIDSLANATTDANGSFSIPLQMGYHTVTVRHGEFSPLTTGIYVAQRSRSFVFYLEPPAFNLSYANGTVRDLVYDTPLQNVNVTFDGNITVFSDAQGFFGRIMPTGFHSVALSLPEYDGLTTTIHIGGRASPYELYLMPNTRSFSGIVRDINETSAIAGASLSFDGTVNVTTDPTGNYTVKLSCGLHDVSVTMAGFKNLTTTLQVTPKTASWNILLTPSGYTPPQPQGALVFRVHDTVTGAPAANVTVWFDGWDRGATDANGTYALTYNAGIFRFILRENAQFWGIDTISRTGMAVYPGRNVTFELYLMPKSGAIKGTVLDVVSGQPIPGISVWYDGWDRNVTGPDGGYLFPYASGNHRLLLRQTDEYDGIDTIGFDGIMVFPGKTSTMDFYIPPRKGALSGTVFDVLTGQPLAGITVWYDGWDRATTDANGSYAFGYWAGNFRMLLRQTDEYDGTDTIGHDGISVFRGRTATADYYLMPRKGFLSGTVYDVISGNPLQGMSVWFDGWDRATTDANGSYSFRYWAGNYRLLTRQTDEFDGMDTVGNAGIVVYRGTHARMDFYVVPRKGTLSGTVYDVLTGDPVANTTVWFDGWDRATTDANGSFSFKYWAGDFRLLVRENAGHDGLDTIGFGGQKVYRGTDTRLDLYVVPRSMSGQGMLTGKVLDVATGEPLDAKLVIWTRTISTGGTGTYVATLPATASTITVLSDGYENLTTRVGVPRVRTTVRNFYLTMQNGTGTLRGMLVDKRDNRTVAGAQLTIYSGYPEPTLFCATTDDFGNFSISLPSRAYSVTVNATGYGTVDTGAMVFADQTTFHKIYLEGSGPAKVLPAELELVALPHYARFFIGDLATMNVRMKNIGDLVGRAEVNFTIPGIFEDTGVGFIDPGTEGDVTFKFIVPDDLAEKDYDVYFTVLGQRYQERIKVVGMKIDVTATLDRKMYIENDTAVLTLNVANLKEFGSSLFSRVKYNGFDESRPFNISALGNATLVFSVPVTGQAQDKLFFSVYASSGRALYVNSTFINRKPAGDVVLSADRQLYKMGESISVSMESSARGIVEVFTPWYHAAIDLNTTHALAIPVPELPSGTYNILYKFGNFSGTYPVDVDGYKVKVVAAGLDGGVHEVGQQIDLSLSLVANRPVDGTLRLSIVDPQGNEMGSAQYGWAIGLGENRVTFGVPFNSSQKTGIHSLVYSYEANLKPDPYELVAGTKAFDAVDRAVPQMQNASASIRKSTSATLVIRSDEKTTCRIEYGSSASYGKTASSPVAGKSHSITLTGLAAGKTYHYRVVLVDMSGNSVTSGDMTVKTGTAKAAEGNVTPLVIGAVLFAAMAIVVAALVFLKYRKNGGRKGENGM